MTNFAAKRAFSYFSTLIILASFFIWPGTILAEENIEKYIDNPDKIELKEKEGKMILQSLVGKLKDRWIEVVTLDPDLNSEKEAVLNSVLGAIQKDLFNYYFVAAPKEVGIDLIKISYRMMKIISSPSGLGGVLDEFERLSVNAAKKYAVNWLLQNEIKVGVGNLSINIGAVDRDFSDIIIYQPINPQHARVSINIYSPKVFEYPPPRLGNQWEGGVDTLRPFIVRIDGEVEKRQSGAYVWTVGPKIDIIFDQPVPEFDFKKPGFFESYILKIKSNINETKVAIGKLGGILDELGLNLGDATRGVFNKMKSIFNDFSFFEASVAPDLSLIDPGIDISKINLDSFPQKEKQIEVIEEITEEITAKQGELTEAIEATGGPEMTLEAVQEIIDDIAEKVDILSQEVAVLMQQLQPLPLA